MPDIAESKGPRHDQILNAATRIFSEKTYHGTTLQDIADAVGMLKGSLYYYIDSKEKLLADIIIEAAKTLNEDLVRVEETDIGPVERLRQIIREHVKFNAIYREAGTLFLTEKNVISSLEMSELVEIFARRDRLLAHALSHAIEAGLYRQVDIRVTSLAIVGLCNSVLFWVRPTGRFSYEEIADDFFNLLHDGLSLKDS
ncbi:TetR/AcrR family transcriptional regulator [Chloroflexota bacterium]